MIQQRTKRGRPTGTLGPVAARILDALCVTPMTAAEVARSLQLSVMAARYTCSRLAAAGSIQVLGHVKVQGSHRPVAVYTVCREAEAAACGAAWFASSLAASA